MSKVVTASESKSVTAHEIFNNIDEILDFYISNGIYTLSFSPFQPIGRGIDDKESYLTGEKIFSAYKKILNRVIEVNSLPNTNVILRERILQNLARSIFANIHDFMCMRAPCGSGRDILGFGVNGDIYLCDDFINDPEYRIGNVYDGSVKEQLLKTSLIKEKSNRAMSELPRCRSCNWRSLCGGICHSSDHYSGANGIEKPDMCIFYQLMIPYMIQRFDENPELPYLLDPTLKQLSVRNVLFSLNRGGDNSQSIDVQLFTSLVKLHHISDRDVVYLCGDLPTDNNELVQMVRTVSDSNATCVLVTNGSGLSDEAYWYSLFDAGLQSVRIELCASNAIDLENQLKNVAEYFRVKNRMCKSCRTILVVPAVSAVSNSSFFTTIKDNFKQEDRMIVYMSSSEVQDYVELNRLLNEFRRYSLESFTSICNVERVKLASANLVFSSEPIDYGVDKILMIDAENLTGTQLERMPISLTL